MSRFLDCLHTGKASVRPGIRSADTKQREGKGKEKKKKRETRITHTRASPPDENPLPPPALISLSLISTECDVDGFPRVIHVPSTFLPSTSRQTAKIAPASGMQRWRGTLGHRGRELESTFQRFTLARYESFIYIYIYRWDLTASFARNFVFFFLQVVDRWTK